MDTSNNQEQNTKEIGKTIIVSPVNHKILSFMCVEYSLYMNDIISKLIERHNQLKQIETEQKLNEQTKSKNGKPNKKR